MPIKFARWEDGVIFEGYFSVIQFDGLVDYWRK